VIIPDGPFKDKEAELTIGCDWVQIEGETGFCMKEGKLKFSVNYDERDLRHIYDLLRKET
jgi:hypothetical protein